jgi:tetratricopeptide (TPR) repeat protein
MIARISKPAQRWWAVIAGLAVLGGVSPLIVEPVAERIRFSLMPDRERDQSSGIVRLFRGFQMSLADVCYAKSTHYQHRGILYQIADENILGEEVGKEQNRLSQGTGETTGAAVISPKSGTHPQDSTSTGGSEAGHPADEGEEEHHHHDITIIPTRENDFRGIIGDVERAVKPFDLGHVAHTEPVEALPWLRLATWINPEHENAWVAMAFWLKGAGRQTPGATSRAIALLEQAVALNPPRKDQPYEKQGLVYMLGHTYLFSAKNPQRALAIFEPLLKRGEADFARLNEVERDWLSYTFRDTIQAARMLGQHDKAIELCKRGIVLYPNDRPFYEMLRREQAELKKRPATPAKNPNASSRR